MDLITLEYVDIEEKKSLQFSKDLLKEPYNIKSLFVIKVEGESMQPLITDQSLAVADLSQTKITDNGIYLVYQENKMWIKKANIKDNKREFISINEEFSHLIFQEKEVRVIAKAVLTFTSL